MTGEASESEGPRAAGPDQSGNESDDSRAPSDAPFFASRSSGSLPPKASGQPSPEDAQAAMPGWIQLLDGLTFLLVMIPVGMWITEMSRWLIALSVIGWLVVAGMWFSYREQHAPAAALAREEEAARRAREQKEARRRARQQVQNERDTEKWAEKEAYAAPRLLDVAIETGAGLACPGCRGTHFIPYRSGARRVAIGGATVLTGGLGGAAAWAVAGKNMLQCVTCQATYRPGATDPWLLERARELEAKRQGTEDN